jgi:hypothetical protein
MRCATTQVSCPIDPLKIFWVAGQARQHCGQQEVESLELNTYPSLFNGDCQDIGANLYPLYPLPLKTSGDTVSLSCVSDNFDL